MADGNGILVTPQYISEAAGQCNTTADELSARLDALKRWVIDLQQRWKGVASDQFSRLMTDYDIFAKMLHNSLVDIGSGLQGNFVNYTDTENANLAGLVNVNGSIPGIGSIPDARL
jgi:WXG100 family type VII secretion target